MSKRSPRICWRVDLMAVGDGEVGVGVCDMMISLVHGLIGCCYLARR
jgi:hypothetical protein